MIDYCFFRGFWEFFMVCCKQQQRYMDLYCVNSICIRFDNDLAAINLIREMNWFRRKKLVYFRKAYWNLEELEKKNPEAAKDP
jgi:hypothetical protein